MMKTEPEPVNLKNDVEAMTDDQKIGYFDELKAKYCQMVEKLGNLERKCSYIGKQVSTLEKVKCKTKNKKKSWKKKFTGQNTTSEQFEAIENDDSIPEGWKSSWRIMDGFSKGTRVKVYWAPNGKFCTSRVAALNYMVTDLKSDEEDVEKMKKSLANDGWTAHDNLPSGWLVFDDPEKASKKFVTPNFHFLKNIKLAVNYLSLHGSESELGQFLVSFALRNEVSTSDFEWLHDEAIPYPWKFAQIKNGKGFSKGMIIISSSGQVLTSVKSVQEFMEKAGETTEDEQKRFIAFLSKHRNSGRTIKMESNNKTESLSDEANVKRGKVEMPIKSERLEKKIKVEKDEVSIKIEKQSEIEKIPKVNKPKYNTLVWNEEDSTIPKGWKSAFSEDGQFAFGQRLKDPKGRMFHGRGDALRNMIKSSEYSKEEIAILRKGLIHDGWMLKDSLPEGWMSRKVKNYSERGIERFTYLTPTYELLDTFEKVFAFMKENKYKEEAIVKFKSSNGLNWHSDEDLPSGWTYAVITTERQGKLKRFMDPKGKFWNSSSQAIKTCFNENPKGEDVVQFRKYMLNKEGWLETEYLPTGWILRQKISEKGFCFMNNVYEKFNTTKAMYKHLRENNYGEQAIKKFDENYKKLQVPRLKIEMEDFKETKMDHDGIDTSVGNEDDLSEIDENDSDDDVAESLEWRSDRYLPEGWLLSETKISEGKLAGTVFRRFRSPCENYFGNLPEALKFLFNKDETTDNEMDLMKRGLATDGWQESSHLPMDWLSKKVKGRGENFLSPSFEVFTNSQDVLDHLKSNDYTEREIVNFKDGNQQWSEDTSVPLENYDLSGTSTPSEFAPPIENDLEPKDQGNMLSLLSGITVTKMNDSRSKSSEPAASPEEVESPPNANKLDWREDPSLPKGWKEAKTSSGAIKFVTSNQKYFVSRIQALQYMTSSGLFSQNEIAKMRKSFEKEGFFHYENLPDDWLQKKGTCNTYLTHTNEKLQSNESVVKFMKENGYDDAAIEKFFEKSSASWNDDDSIPKGWKRSMISYPFDSSKTWFKYLSPDGKVLSSRAQALKFMRSVNTFEEEDIEKMKSGLQKDGWVIPPNFPPGWYLKRRDQFHSNYLTPEFETLKSLKNVISHMKMKNYDPDLIRNLKPNFSSNNDVPETPIKRKLDPNASSSSSPRNKSPRTSQDSNDMFQINAFRASRPFKINQKDKNLTDWLAGDHTLPEGWKKRLHPEAQIILLMSPQNTIFNNRAEAFKFMIDHPELFSKSNVEEMDSKLVYEEWHTNPLLPAGWRMKKLQGDVLTLTETGALYKVVKSARAKIRINYSEDDLKKFTSLMDSLKPNNREVLNSFSGIKFEPSLSADNSLPIEPSIPAEEELKDPLDVSTTSTLPNTGTVIDVYNIKKEKSCNDEESSNSVIEPPVKIKQEPVTENMDEKTDILPVGWKIEKNEYSEEILLNQNGKRFTSRRDAVEFMIKNGYAPRSIYNLWNSLDIEGWVLHSDRIPEGWRAKYFPVLYDYKYLTREMKIIHSTEEASFRMKTSGGFDQEKFEDWASEVKKSAPKIVWKTDPSLPSKWVISSGLENEIIKDPKGALFEGRKEAIDHMIKEQCTPTDIFKLWNTLHREGWITDEENLPTGWKRKYFSDKNRHHYLSPMMEVVKSSSSLLQIVKTGKEYTEEEVKRVENWKFKELNVKQ